MKLSEATVRAALAANGWNFARTGAALGLSRQAVRRRVQTSVALEPEWRAQAAHIRGHGRGRPAAHVALTLDMVTAALREHGTMAAAGRALGITRQAVSRWVHRHGIDRATATTATPAEAA